MWYLILVLGIYIDPELKWFNQDSVSVLIELNAERDTIDIINAGVKIRGKFGNIITARISKELLDTVMKISTIKRIDASKPLDFYNDRAAQAIATNNLQVNGITGEGVVLGILDEGFDLSHPDFWKYGQPRVKFFWDQTDNSLPYPQNFTYGKEYVQSDILEHPVNLDSNGHGTEVAGSAGGNDTLYRGSAPGADLIFVKMKPDEVSCLDAIKYVEMKSESLQEPFVVNLSFGNQYGPHNGNTLFERAINYLVENDSTPETGRCITSSAGNYGGSLIHFSGTIYGGDTLSPWNEGLYYTIIKPLNNAHRIGVNIFYEKSETVNVKIGYKDISFSQWFYKGDFFEEKVDTGSIDSIYISNDDYDDSLSRIYIVVVGKGAFDMDSDWLSLYFYAPIPTKIDGWIFSDNAYFGTEYKGENFLSGDDANEIGPPGSAKDVITVGAFTTKTAWVDWNGYSHNVTGAMYEPVFWSSRGPLTNGVVKPDFICPGRMIVSSSPYLSEISPDFIIDRTHSISYGTSFSSAFLCGAIALLLQEAPSLNFQEIYNLIKEFSSNNVTQDSVQGWGIPDIKNSANIIDIGVQFEWFTYTIKEEGVQLNWRTMAEGNIRKWKIYRDGELIGELEAHPFSSIPHNYIFLDNPNSGEEYFYTLMASGREDIKYGNLRVSVDRYLPPFEYIKLKPSIFKNRTTIITNFPYKILKVYNIMGQYVGEVFPQGKRIVKWEATLHPGIYFIGWKNHLTKFIIIK